MIEAKRDSSLEIRNLSKSYGPVKALDGISLSIGQGEFACFLGPSGCGKTTLLRAIAGLDVQDYGKILQGGRDISSLPIRERDFGVVFQSYALFPNLTIGENVGFGLHNAGYRAADTAARVRETLEMVGLGSHAARYPAQLSGGQQQRVALARAIALKPGLLLLDEPLSALDAQVRIRLRDEIKALQRELGITTIMVTHDQDEALAIADRIVVMNHGVIEQVGTPEEIYSRPASLFTAGFIGEMNLLAATVADSTHARLGEITLPAALPAQASPGMEVTLAIRPDEFVVMSEEPLARVMTEGTVTGSSFRGYFRRLRVELPQTGRLTVDIDLPADTARHIATGDRVKVGFPETPALAF